MAIKVASEHRGDMSGHCALWVAQYETVPILDQASPAFSLVRLPPVPFWLSHKRPELIDFDLAQVQIVGQHLRDGLCMRRYPAHAIL